MSEVIHELIKLAGKVTTLHIIADIRVVLNHCVFRFLASVLFKKHLAASLRLASEIKIDIFHKVGPSVPKISLR